MGEKPNTGEKPYASPKDGLKALEKKVGYKPTIKEQMDTLENFKDKLAVADRILKEAKIMKDNHRNSHSSDTIISYYQKTNYAIKIIDELKISKAPITQKEMEDLKKLEKTIDKMI